MVLNPEKTLLTPCHPSSPKRISASGTPTKGTPTTSPYQEHPGYLSRLAHSHSHTRSCGLSFYTWPTGHRAVGSGLVGASGGSGESRGAQEYLGVRRPVREPEGATRGVRVSGRPDRTYPSECQDTFSGLPRRAERPST